MSCRLRGLGSVHERPPAIEMRRRCQMEEELHSNTEATAESHRKEKEFPHSRSKCSTILLWKVSLHPRKRPLNHMGRTQESMKVIVLKTLISCIKEWYYAALSMPAGVGVNLITNRSLAKPISLSTRQNVVRFLFVHRGQFDLHVPGSLDILM
jgi:hypothetical protein